MPDEENLSEKKEIKITKAEPVIIKKSASPLDDNSLIIKNAASPLLCNQRNNCQMPKASHLSLDDNSLIIKKEKNGKDIDDGKNIKNGKGRKKGKEKKGAAWKWVLIVIVATFVLSISFSYISQQLSDLSIVVAFIVLVFFVIVNIIFDIIAVAATACDIEPFLATASRKIKGAKIAVKITKNAEKISSICGDIVGDICGIISGSLGAFIVVNLISKHGVTLNDTWLSIIFSSSIAALTVGGKALGKKFALDNCQRIIFFISRILSVFSRNK